MTDPTVACILLTADRPELTKRAVRCFQAQMYEKKRLLILDTGARSSVSLMDGTDRVAYAHIPDWKGTTIGTLRNLAIERARHPWDFDVIAHLDSDDYSHPNRITEQVALLQSSGKEVVGYRDMLFWRDRQYPSHKYEGTDWTSGWFHREKNCPICSEAWLFSRNDPRYCLGTSLAYWRKTWERKPFKDLPKGGSTGEDWDFIDGLDSIGVSSLGGAPRNAPESREHALDRPLGPNMGYGIAPRMIASIHGNNTSGQYLDIEKSHSWKRVPEWYEYCRKTMEEV